MTALALVGSETIARSARIGVALIDPVTLATVGDGMTVVAGFDRPPRRSLTGLFYWLVDHGPWPAKVSVLPGSRPYESQEETTQAEPGDDHPEARLTRIVLRPTPAYDFPDGITVVRGRLVETVAHPAPIAGAEMWLSRAVEKPDGTSWIDATTPTRSTATGDFAVFSRLHAPPATSADAVAPKYRITAKRDGEIRAAERDVIEGATLDLGSTPLAWEDMT